MKASTNTYKPHFDGPDYVPPLDHARLTDQMGRIRALMLDGQWRTLAEIRAVTGDPEASISAQLRHLRKPRFGEFVISKRRRGEGRRGLFEYQLREPEPQRDWISEIARPM
jgi:hypothetical protein